MRCFEKTANSCVVYNLIVVAIFIYIPDIEVSIGLNCFSTATFILD